MRITGVMTGLDGLLLRQCPPWTQALTGGFRESGEHAAERELATRRRDGYVRNLGKANVADRRLCGW